MAFGLAQALIAVFCFATPVLAIIAVERFTTARSGWLFGIIYVALTAGCLYMMMPVFEALDVAGCADAAGHTCSDSELDDYTFPADI